MAVIPHKGNGFFNPAHVHGHVTLNNNAAIVVIVKVVLCAIAGLRQLTFELEDLLFHCTHFVACCLLLYLNTFGDTCSYSVFSSLFVSERVHLCLAWKAFEF